MAREYSKRTEYLKEARKAMSLKISQEAKNRKNQSYCKKCQEAKEKQDKHIKSSDKLIPQAKPSGRWGSYQQPRVSCAATCCSIGFFKCKLEPVRVQVMAELKNKGYITYSEYNATSELAHRIKEKLPKSVNTESYTINENDVNCLWRYLPGDEVVHPDAKQCASGNALRCRQTSKTCIDLHDADSKMRQRRSDAEGKDFGKVETKKSTCAGIVRLKKLKLGDSVKIVNKEKQKMETKLGKASRIISAAIRPLALSEGKHPKEDTIAYDETVETKNFLLKSALAHYTNQHDNLQEVMNTEEADKGKVEIAEKGKFTDMTKIIGAGKEKVCRDCYRGCQKCIGPEKYHCDGNSIRSQQFPSGSCDSNSAFVMKDPYLLTGTCEKYLDPTPGGSACISECHPTSTTEIHTKMSCSKVTYHTARFRKLIVIAKLQVCTESVVDTDLATQTHIKAEVCQLAKLVWCECMTSLTAKQNTLGEDGKPGMSASGSFSQTQGDGRLPIDKVGKCTSWSCKVSKFSRSNSPSCAARLMGL